MGVVGGHGVGHRGETGVVLTGGRWPVGRAVVWCLAGVRAGEGRRGRWRRRQWVVVVGAGRHTVRVGVVRVLSGIILIVLSSHQPAASLTLTLAQL